MRLIFDGRRCTAWVLFLATLCGPQSVTCADVTPAPTTPAGLSASAGYTGDLQSDHSSNKNSFYYKVIVKGNMLGSSGTAPSPTDPTKSFSVPNPNISTDTNGFSLKLEQGNAKINTGTFDGIGGQTLTVPLGALGAYRGSVELSGTLDGKQINSAAGVETYALHPLDWVALNREHKNTDWLVLGFNGEHQSSSGTTLSNGATGVTQTSALFTYRTFIGVPGPWKTREPGTPILKDDAILSTASTLKDFITKYPDQPTIISKFTEPAAQSVALVLLALDGPTYIPSTNPEYTDAAWWKAQAHQAVANYLKAHYLTPEWTFDIESSGWYTASGNPLGSKAKALFAADFSYALSGSTNQSNSIEVRYEDGFDRAAPTVRLNRIMVMLSIDTQ